MEQIEQKPKLTVSGYRGIWEKDLNEQVAFEYVFSFAKMIKQKGGKKILVGRDARKTGEIILRTIESALKKENIKIEYAGIIPTPSVLLLVRKLNYDGGIIITASHNPPEYNGLKFVMGTGLFTIQEEVEEILKIKESLSESEKKYIENTEARPMGSDNTKYRKIHIDEILKNIDVNLIKSKNFKVALDPINSAGSIITQELLKELGCIVFVINGKTNGEFAHMPEPIAKNLEQISIATKNNNADIGFAQDPDADRLVVINERGEILNEEYTLALAVKNVMQKTKGNVVINISTSKMNEDILNEYRGEIFRSKVGEANVVEQMIKLNAVIGGEGNGGVIYPNINTARDSLVGIALILELMAKENKKISEIINNLPKYFMKKDKITFTGNLNLLYEKLKKDFEDALIDRLDGVRFDFRDSSWIHIRPSNTEPVVRIIGEAKDEKTINTLFDKVRLTLNLN